MKIANDTPLITVITVTLNSSNTVARTLKSVLNQTFEDIEYLVIDGLSNDNTVEIINDLFNDYSGGKKLKLITEKDDGISSAFNKGIRIASGKFLMFLNSDDYLINNFILLQISTQLIDFKSIYCGNMYIESLDKIVCSKVESNMAEYEVLHPASMIGNEVFKEIGEFDESFKIAMDTEFFIRAKRNNIFFSYIDATITIFSNLGISHTNILSAIIENDRARGKNKNTPFIKRLYYFIGGIRVVILSKFWK